MKDRFNPVADWPGTVPTTAEQLDIQTARQEAYSRVVQDLPVASRLYAVRNWLHAAPINGLLGELLQCMVAADCWAIRFACPQSGFAGSEWDRYWMARREAARPFVSAALARWAVLERIPICWIPEEGVRAELGSRITALGLQGDVVGLHLTPPLSGGSEWVARDSGHNITALRDRARQTPVAAILHWPDRTAAAIVAAVDDRLKAFGTAFGPDGFLFDAKDLAGGTVVPQVEPPTSWLYQCAHALGLHRVVWRVIRYCRLRQGGQPLAAI